MELQRFDPSAENIALITKLINTQGKEVCQNKIDMDYIKHNMSTHSFGYVSMTQKAQIGRRSIKNDNDKYTVNGFVICRINPAMPRLARIELVCSRPTSRIGKLLMEVAEDECLSLGTVSLIQLLSLDNNKLINWYKSMGYVADTISVWDGKPKGALMSKFL